MASQGALDPRLQYGSHGGQHHPQHMGPATPYDEHVRGNPTPTSTGSVHSQHPQQRGAQSQQEGLEHHQQPYYLPSSGTGRQSVDSGDQHGDDENVQYSDDDDQHESPDSIRDGDDQGEDSKTRYDPRWTGVVTVGSIADTTKSREV